MTTNFPNLLKFATVQLGAESTRLTDVMTDQALRAAVIFGNGRSSKFASQHADEFSNASTGWSVVKTEANTTTGFSGTLFKNNATQELVISFRSTEFADDAARDNEATNKFEIAKYGFALRHSC